MKTAKIPQFGLILQVGDPVPTRFTDQDQIWHERRDPRYFTTPNFTFIGKYGTKNRQFDQIL